jgi:M6 family metalloprotease-like protein
MRITGLFLTLTLTTVADLYAQTPAPVPPSTPLQFAERGVFVPSGGYKRTVDMLRFDRLVQAASARAGAPSTRPLALSGTHELPVILVSFKNRAPAFKPIDYAHRLFSEPSTSGALPMKTMSQYYRDVSAGRFNLRGTVLDWSTLKNNDAFYENNSFDSHGTVIRLNNGSGEPFGDLLNEALTDADRTVDFAEYDNDGPDQRPNSGDDDGKVDTVLIIHSEAGGECGGDDRTNIWSHSGHYSDPTYGHSGPFETRAIRKDGVGNPILKADGSPEHIVIDDYTIQPGLACHDTDASDRIVDIGVVCHEYGHALGLPDLYDRTPEANPDSSGIGDYCVMAYGCDDRHADSPTYMSAWARAYLGWTTLQPIHSGALILEPAIFRGRAYVFDVPGTNGKEYFLVEYRDRLALPPPGHVNWDAALPTSGLAIWHVDERVGEQSREWPFSEIDKGQNDAPTLPLPAGAGFMTPHSLVSLVQADRLLELEKGINRFGPGDLWSDTNDFHDDATFIAGARGYDGRPTGLRLNIINLAAGTVQVSTNDLQFAGAAAPAAAPVAALTSPAVSKARPSAPPVEGVNLAKEHPADLNRADLDRAIKRLLRANKSAEVSIQFAADSKSIRSVTGLAVPKRGDTAATATQLLMRDVPELAGGVTLNRAKSYDGVVKFDQTVTVGNESLPLFDRGAVAHFGGKYLKAITTDVIDPSKLLVTGIHTTMTADDAKAQVTALLRVSAAKILSAREGVHLIDHDPAKARVAFEVMVDAGDERAPIKVIVDEASRQVLDIK